MEVIYKKSITKKLDWQIDGSHAKGLMIEKIVLTADEWSCLPSVYKQTAYGADFHIMVGNLGTNFFAKYKGVTVVRKKDNE